MYNNYFTADPFVIIRAFKKDEGGYVFETIDK